MPTGNVIEGEIMTAVQNHFVYKTNHHNEETTHTANDQIQKGNKDHFEYVGRDVFKSTLEGSQRQGDATVATTRPSWISADEEAWFNRADNDGLQPVATLANNTVTVKLKKQGLTADDLVSVLIPHRAWSKTDIVETSFDFTVGSQNYFLTVTVAGGDFMAAITSYNISVTDNDFYMHWEKVADETAEALIATPEFHAGLRSAMSDAGITEDFDRYLHRVESNISDIGSVTGSHRYNFATGYYQYEQHVFVSSWIKRQAIYAFGSNAIKGAALKTAYGVVNAPSEYYGTRGQQGVAVTDMEGNSLKAST